MLCFLENRKGHGAGLQQHGEQSARERPQMNGRKSMSITERILYSFESSRKERYTVGEEAQVLDSGMDIQETGQPTSQATDRPDSRTST